MSDSSTKNDSRDPRDQFLLRDQFLKSAHAGKWCWVSGWGWMRWAAHEDGGGRWERDPLGPQAEAQAICEAAGVKARKASMVRAVIDLVQPYMTRSPDDFDHNPQWLNTPAGAIDLATGRMRTPTDDEIMPTRITRVAPASGKPTAFLKFLTEVLPDKQTLAWLMRQLGYALTGYTRERVFHVWHGSGCNGKSTLLELLAWILGDYSVGCPADMFLRRKHQPHRERWARLAGARLITAQEIPAREQWNEAELKTICGGDRITANFMRAASFDYTPQGMLVIAGNCRPRFAASGHAIHDRLRLVEFGVRIEDPDPQLPDSLRDEAPQILRLLAQEARAYLKDGLLPIPDALDSDAEQYVEEADTLAHAIREVTEPGLYHKAVLGMEIVKALGEYARQTGTRVDWDPRDVYESVRAMGFAERNPVDRRGVSFLGLAVRDDYQQAVYDRQRRDAV